jgi:hypothetical protein
MLSTSSEDASDRFVGDIDAILHGKYDLFVFHLEDEYKCFLFADDVVLYSRPPDGRPVPNHIVL